MGFVQVHWVAAAKVSVFGHVFVALIIEASLLFLAEEWARTIPNPFRFSAIGKARTQT